MFTSVDVLFTESVFFVQVICFWKQRAKQVGVFSQQSLCLLNTQAAFGGRKQEEKREKHQFFLIVVAKLQ